MATGRPNAMRSFDPRLVGDLESRTWVAYYQRDWPAFLRAAMGLTRQACGLSWPAALRGAWLVLRANQAWAAHPKNDPDRARRCMQRFYRLVSGHHVEPFDVQEAARLEVDWWRLHRELQPGRDQGAAGRLVDGLVALYSHVYAVPAATVRTAATERALAMRHSDTWVAEGCRPESPQIEAARAALVRSYAALLASVHRA